MSLSEKILEVLEDDADHSVADLHKAVSGKRKAKEKAIDRLLKSGKIERVSRGVYRRVIPLQSEGGAVKIEKNKNVGGIGGIVDFDPNDREIDLDFLDEGIDALCRVVDARFKDEDFFQRIERLASLVHFCEDAIIRTCLPEFREDRHLYYSGDELTEDDIDLLKGEIAGVVLLTYKDDENVFWGLVSDEEEL